MLQTSFGRIEPRSRFKHRSGQPTKEGRHSDHLFIDECGISPTQPNDPTAVFALGAIAMHAAASSDYVERADALKRRFFQTTEITFHEPAMRNFDGAFRFGGDRSKAADFDVELDGLVDASDFTAFGVGIRKTAFAAQFGASGLDPYLPTDVYSIAIMLLLERYVDYICGEPERRMGRVTFESQGPKEDALHQLAYSHLLVEGTQWVPESAFRQAIEPGARFEPKSGSNPMELADMLSRDLWEWVRSGCEGAPKRWELFGKHIYCRGSRQMGTFGVKVFPDSDIRQAIEAHRSAAGPTPLP